jgi:hypothetical protein
VKARFLRGPSDASACRKNGRFEAQLHNQGASIGRVGRRGGEQVYLGVYTSEESAAHSYDRAAIKFYGEAAHLNVSCITPPEHCCIASLER